MPTCLRLMPLLVVLALASPARAAAPGSPTSLLRLTLAPRLTPAVALGTPFDGGGDGIVTGPTRTLGWILFGAGALATGAGVLQFKDSGDGKFGVTLLAAGGVALLAGAILIWTTGCVSCASCGIVDNQPVEPPARESLATAVDAARRASDGVRGAAAFAFLF